MTQKSTVLVSREFINDIFEQEEKTGRDIVDIIRLEEDIEGLCYARYRDKRSGVEYICRTTRTIHIGFNDTPAEKVAEVREVVEREGVALASWGVMGRTMHEILAHQLSKQLPEYKFEIYGYTCRIKKGATV